MIDFDHLQRLYKLSINLTPRDIQSILSAAKRKTYAANEYILKEGSLENNFYFIRKGIVRYYKINASGDDITNGFWLEDQFFANMDVLLFEQPLRFYVQALEQTDIFYMPYETAESIVFNRPKLEENRKFILRSIIKEGMERIESFVMLSPEERYVHFVEKNPDIVNRVPDKYIAHVLGITPVSLSRIRKRIASKKNR